MFKPSVNHARHTCLIFCIECSVYVMQWERGVCEKNNSIDRAVGNDGGDCNSNLDCR